MSSLIFYVDADQALVFTDTLVADLDGSPLWHQEKAEYLPELRTIVAATGVGLLSDWTAFLKSSSPHAAGIEELDAAAPAYLRQMWCDWQERCTREGVSQDWRDKTLTIYHFGISERTGKVTGIAYRSTDDFNAQRIEPNFYAKPPPTTSPEGSFENMESLAIAIMERQREEQAEIENKCRIVIGGEVLFSGLTPDGFTRKTLHRFPDYDESLPTL